MDKLAVDVAFLLIVAFFAVTVTATKHPTHVSYGHLTPLMQTLSGIHEDFLNVAGIFHESLVVFMSCSLMPKTLHFVFFFSDLCGSSVEHSGFLKENDFVTDNLEANVAIRSLSDLLLPYFSFFYHFRSLFHSLASIS